MRKYLLLAEILVSKEFRAEFVVCRCGLRGFPGNGWVVSADLH